MTTALESVFARIRKNIGMLYAGNAIVLLCTFAVVALNARALGPEMLGVLVLIQSFSQTLARVISFETWQPMIRFGAVAKDKGDGEQFAAITNMGLVLDICAAVLAAIAAQAIIWSAGSWFGISGETLSWCSLYAISIVFLWTGTATGILRLSNWFSVLTGLSVAAAIARALLALALFVSAAPFLHYVIGFAIIDAMAAFAGLVAASVAIRRRKIPFRGRLFERWPERSVTSSFLSFAWTSSALGAVNAVRMQSDLWIATLLLGPAAAALYGIAQRLTAPILMLADPIRHAIHPEIASFAAKGQMDNVWAVGRRVLRMTAMVAIPLVFCYVLLGSLGIRVLAGQGFEDAYWPLLALAVSGALYLMLSFFPPMVLTLCHPSAFLLAFVAGAIVSVPVTYLTILALGIDGAGAGQVAFVMVWAAVIALSLRYFRQKTPVAAGPDAGPPSL